MASEMTVSHETQGNGGRFVLQRDGVQLGTLDYSHAGPGIVHVDYVEVAPVARGTGLGRVLVEAAVQWARAEQVGLVPICGYAASVLRAEPAWHDVLG